MRRAGLLSSSVLFACGLVVAVERELYLPALPVWAVAVASTVLAVPTIALALAKAVFKDNLHMEFHDGQLHVEWVPVSGTTCGAEAVEVRALLRFLMAPAFSLTCDSLRRSCTCYKVVCPHLGN